MSTPDMAAYLLERIAEDGWSAREAAGNHPGPWVQGGHDHGAATAHVVRWDPARVLTECEAKRRVVEHCLEVRAHHVYGDWGATDMAEEVLQRLVQAHADRPDFPPEWLPEVPW